MEDTPQSFNASTIDLPEDLSLCHELIRQLHDTAQQSQRRIEKLEHQLAQLLRARYGPRSERIDESQLTLFAKELLEAEPGNASEAQGDEDVVSPGKTGRRRGRKPLPKNLPRKRVVHELPADQLACPCCRQPRTKIGEEISEQLEYEPGSLYVIEHVRPTYACKNCEAHLITADKPLQPIDKGLPGPGLLAHVITSKYSDHRVQGEAVSEMREGPSWPGDRTRPQTSPELRRSRAVVGSVGRKRCGMIASGEVCEVERK